ncbi:glycosyltransferase family 4 protein [Comamonas sediminis]|uniref:Glycosyltransferase family 4 protein n=2 Tax=Comamonas sediminis TaxID=1783360 RepID=A0ABV4B4I0_9BURK
MTMTDDLLAGEGSSSVRVLVLVDAFPVVSQTFIVDHIEGLAQRGILVTLISRQLYDASFQPLQKGIAVYGTPKWSRRALYNFISIIFERPSCLFSALLIRCAWHAARLRDTQAIFGVWNAVHAHFANNGIIALLTNPSWKSRLLVNFHGHDATSLPYRYGWWPFQSVLGRAHAIVHSKFLADCVSQNTSMEVHDVCMGVNTQKFRGPQRGKEWPVPLRLLFVGRLVEQKGAHIALLALALFREHHPGYDAHLCILGEGPEEARLQSLIKKLNMDSVVEGPRPASHQDVADAMFNADILLMPSQIGKDHSQESFGRVAIEAMACGMPVLGCPSGGLVDTISDAGLIASGFDAASFYRALFNMVADATPEIWRELAIKRAARHRLELMNLDYFNQIKIIEEKNL